VDELSPEKALLCLKRGCTLYMDSRASTCMSVTPVITKLYPVVLALANTSLGIGLYATDALVFAVLMWITGALVLIGLLSSVAPGVLPRLEGLRDVSR